MVLLICNRCIGAFLLLMSEKMFIFCADSVNQLNNLVCANGNGITKDATLALQGTGLGEIFLLLDHTTALDTTHHSIYLIEYLIMVMFHTQWVTWYMIVIVIIMSDYGRNEKKIIVDNMVYAHLLIAKKQRSYTKEYQYNITHSPYETIFKRVYT